MTTFQLLCLVLFAGVVLVAYGKDIYGWLKARLPKLRPPLGPAAPNTPTGDVLVDELLDVVALRDYFAKVGCAEGVEACSLLLRILIDHKHPHAE